MNQESADSVWTGTAGTARAAYEEVRAYWNARIHDTLLSDDPPGSAGFFAAMDAYRYGRLDYLPDLLDFERWRDRDVLDLGCGAGLDLVRFARAGSNATGVELPDGPIALARQCLEAAGCRADLVQADAAQVPFRAESFDLVLCHGVLPFAVDCPGIVREIWRVLRHGGVALIVAYNRRSWMSVLRALYLVREGHGDAPIFRTHTLHQFDALLAPFPDRFVWTERFPGPTRVLPRRFFGNLGWHLVARCRKSAPGTRERR